MSSMLSFTIGALLPLAAILLPPAAIRIPVTFVAVIVALCLTGALSAHLGRSPKGRAIVRLVTGGTLAMVVTYGSASCWTSPSCDVAAALASATNVTR